MKKPIKINKQEYTNIYFNSDNHRNHNRDFLFKPRGFSSIGEHDKWLDDHFFNTKPTDLIVMLGDNALTSSLEETLKWFQRIPAKKLLIFGNHSSWDYPIYKESLKNWCLYKGIPEVNFEIFPLSVNSKNFKYKVSDSLSNSEQLDILSGFENNLNYDTIFLGYEENIKIDNTFLYCRHMAPFIFDKMKYENYVCVCGHSHGNCPEINVERKDFNKILDIGVDNAKKHNGTPFFKFEEVVEIMKKKTIRIWDHHGDEHI